MEVATAKGTKLVGASGNTIFKAKYRSYFLQAVAISIIVHIILIAVLPGMSPPDFGTKVTETIVTDIPPEIAIPPPPAKIAKPAVPVEAAVEEDVSEEITIAETTPEVDIPIAPSIEEQPVFTPYEVAPVLIKSTVNLVYPELLKKAGIEGTVLLWILINTDGTVKKVQVFKSSGNSALDDAAMRAYQKARFTPAYSRDIPVKVWVQWPVKFTLK
ncbi:MAG: energy transducer TonB [Candidatus Glassbacteria bacterium]